MRKHLIVAPLAAAIAWTLCANSAYAHQPRLVRDQPSYEVRNPEISQAFYAWLNGSAQSYYIRSDVPFHLYLNLLVPDLPGIARDFTAVVYKDKETAEAIVTTLNGASYAWKPFFEPFGGDHYLMGPEFEKDVEPGLYIVMVSRPGLAGKYALAVGKKEKFPPGEILRTIGLLPQLKKQFFGKSPLSAYFNLSGAFILIVLAGFVGLASLFF
jgi:hypothetical protein